MATDTPAAPPVRPDEGRYVAVDRSPEFAALRKTFRGFVFPVIFFVVIPFSLYWSSRSNVRTLAPQQRNHRYEFASDAIRINTGLSSAVVAWEAVQKMVETQSAFYLYLQKSICHVIPKRGLKSEVDLGRLRTILATKLSSKAKLKGDRPHDQATGGG